MKSIFSIITSPEKRYFGFDIVRAFSVILVSHIHFFYAYAALKGFNIFTIPFPDPVNMFFVCSGFLIGYAFLKEIDRTDKLDKKFVGRFLVMRWGRTLPAYYFMLFFLTCLTCLITKRIFIPYLNIFFLQNSFGFYSTFYKETWTVSIEEWFYVIFPFSFLFIYAIVCKSKHKAFLGALFFMIAASISLKLFYYFKAPFNKTVACFLYYKGITVLRLDTIAVGLLAAYICYKYPERCYKYRYMSLFTGLVIYFITSFFLWAWTNENMRTEFPDLKPLPWHFKFATGKAIAFYHYIFYDFLNPFALALCLPYLKSIKYKPSFLNNSILYISFISYSIFLIHETFIKNLTLGLYVLKIVNNIYTVYIIWISLSLIIAHQLYKRIELPFMNKRKAIIEYLKLEEQQHLYFNNDTDKEKKPLQEILQ